MEALDQGPVPRKAYTTPRWVQAWFLGKSRDRWKQKYMALKADAKRLSNRVYDATHSRDRWRRRAEELEAENAALRTAALKKSGPGDAGTRAGPPDR